MTVADLSGCRVVELRRYTLHRGGLAPLLEVFERHLVEPQEDVGMRVAGTFADEGDPDAFVWWRGFADHESRVRALGDFYGGPVWARHADAANATMVDSDDVLLLRATRPPHSPAPAVPRAAAGGGPAGGHRVVVEVLGLEDDPRPEETETWFASEAHARLETLLGWQVATWRTDPEPNGFPRLPVRTDRVVVWAATFADADARDEALARLDGDALADELRQRTTWQRRLLLTPTTRSAHPRPERAAGA